MYDFVFKDFELINEGDSVYYQQEKEKWQKAMEEWDNAAVFLKACENDTKNINKDMAYQRRGKLVTLDEVENWIDTKESHEGEMYLYDMLTPEEQNAAVEVMINGKYKKGNA